MTKIRHNKTLFAATFGVFACSTYVYYNKDNLLINQCAKSNIFFAKCLIKMGANTNAVNWYQTPLINAIDADNLELVNILIDNGADVDFSNKMTLYPLQMAIFRNNYHMVMLLLDRGEADVNIHFDNEMSAETPLILAAADANTSEGIFELLCDVFDADINFRDRNKQTALDHAIYHENKKSATALLKYGAKRDIETLRRAVNGAIINGNFEMVSLLINQGFDINEKTSDNENILMLCVSGSMYFGNKLAMAKLLIANGIDVNCPDKDNKNAVLWATRCSINMRDKPAHRFDMLNLLLKNGVKIPEHLLASLLFAYDSEKELDIDLIKLLCNSGEDINKAISLLSENNFNEDSLEQVIKLLNENKISVDTNY